MKSARREGVVLYDFSPRTDDFEEAVLEGLSRREKSIPSKFFYDEKGSQLFEDICELEEYYLTRTELSIMREFVHEMVDGFGPRCRIVEFGSGSSVKTRILLNALEDPAAYVPVDISGDHLLEAAEVLAEEMPDLLVQPVAADYTEEFQLPPTGTAVRRTVIYFPGSTVGNLAVPKVVLLLRRMQALLSPDGGVLIGLDLKKDRDTLERAYNDEAGVTAEFNLNLLRRINRELDGDFDLGRFRHRAIYNPEEGRIEMFLVSEEKQTVRVAGRAIAFEEGESICTEYSQKYSSDQFDEIAKEGGFEVQRTWMDREKRFAVKYLA